MHHIFLTKSRCLFLQFLVVPLLSLIFSKAFATSIPNLAIWLNQNHYQSVPLLEKNNLLYIKGMVMSHPCYFLLDTGSDDAHILTTSLSSLNLISKESNHQEANMVGQRKAAKYVTITDIKISGFNLPPIRASIMSEPFKNELPTIILGINFLKNYHAIIDLTNHQVYLSSSALSKKASYQLEQELEKNSYNKIYLTEIYSGHLLIPIEINQHQPAYFLFDTGTSDTTISQAYAKKLDIKSSFKKSTQAATDGSITIQRLLLNSLNLNPLQNSFNTPVQLFNENVYVGNIENLTQILGVEGVLGLAEIKSLKSIIVIPTRLLYTQAK